MTTTWIPTNIELGDGLTVTAIRVTPLQKAPSSEKGRIAYAVSFVFNRRLISRGWKIWVPADKTKTPMLLPPQTSKKVNGKWENFIYTQMPRLERELLLSQIAQILRGKEQTEQKAG